MLRCMKLALEERVDAKVTSATPIMKWLCEHVAATINRFHVHDDGKSKRTGKKCDDLVADLIDVVSARSHGHGGFDESKRVRNRKEKSIHPVQNGQAGQGMACDDGDSICVVLSRRDARVRKNDHLSSSWDLRVLLAGLGAARMHAGRARISVTR